MNFPRHDADRPIATEDIAGRQPPYWIFFLYGFVAIAVLLIMAISIEADISFGIFTRDPMAVAEGKPYFGLLSNVGILFWCAATTLCFFISSLIQDAASQPSRRFFIMSGLFTLLLLLDDLFLLHEDVLPHSLGIRQRYVLLLYLLLALLYLVSYWKVIFSKHPVVMTVALALFALSLTEDALALAPERWRYLLEDGAKLFGIVSWFNYFVLVCREEVQRCIVNSPKFSPAQTTHPSRPGRTSTKKRSLPSPLSSVPDG